MSSSDFTQMLNNLGSKGREVNEMAFALAYEELRLLAQARLHGHAAGAHTLSPTGLVHQAFLKMVDLTRVTWHGKRHFMSIAAHAMRRILINHARDKKAQKRGGRAPVVSLQEALALPEEAPSEVLLALDEALQRLSTFDETKAKIVELRYFGGLTEHEVAEVLDLSRSTVQRHWYAARAWLYQELKALF